MIFHLTYFLKILKNTLIVKYLELFTKKCYPVSILPSLKHIQEISIDSICKSHNLIISRRIKSIDSKNLFNEVGHLRDNIIEPKEVPMLSLNLMGGKFEPFHLKFRTIKKGNDKWDGIKKILLSEFLSCYEILSEEEFTFVYFDGKKIHATEFPYYQPSSPELKTQVDHFFSYFPKPKISTDGFEFKGKVIIKHDPTNLNYWHLELNTIDYSDNTIKNYNKSAWQKRLFSHVINNILIINALPSQSLISPIPDIYFKK
jgi:hypothetical protein